MSAMRRSKSAAKASSDLEKVFRKFDANGDGRISASELESLLRSLGSNTSRDEVSRMMSEMDKDGDGFIDLHEFVDFHRGSEEIVNASGNGANHELREAFKMYDKDNNGLISARELHTVLKSLGEKVSLKDCSRMISSVDVDGDGHVNFEEFKKMMR